MTYKPIASSGTSKETLANVAYQAIVDAIHSGQCRANDRIVEKTWAAQLDISVTPVREALRRLEADGVLVYDPHSGVRVRGWSLDQARQLYEARASLESEIAALAADRRQPEELTLYRQCLDEQKRTFGEGDFTEAQRYDTLLHLALGQMARNEILQQFLSKVWLLVPILRTMVWKESQAERNLDHMIPDHELLYVCLERRLPETAATVARHHVLEAWSRLENTESLQGGSKRRRREKLSNRHRKDDNK